MKRPTLLFEVLILLCVVSQARASSCTSSGNDIPAADIALGADNLNQNGSLDLLISANRASALRMFYTVSGHQFAVTLPPESLHPPTQTSSIQGIKATTTFIVVAKRNGGATVCSLTVPFNLPTNTTFVSQGQLCPQGYAWSGFGGSAGPRSTICVRVAPAFDNGNPEFDPTFDPSTGMRVCDKSGFFVSVQDNGQNLKCRSDSWSAINPISNLETIQRDCKAFAVPGKVRFSVGIQLVGGLPLRCGSRLLQIPEDPSATAQTQAAANAFAAAP